MPEGDTIFRAARTLARVLEGKQVLAVRSPDRALSRAGLEGRRIDAVRPHGKNLLIHFDDGRVLHTHMRMTGSWHVYRSGEAWQKPAELARIVIEVDGWSVPCFSAPVVDLVSSARAREIVGDLGPDILGASFDSAEARRRMREMNAMTVGEAVLIQSAVAGIGNIYKSESLFLRGLSPLVRIGQLGDEEIDELLLEARQLMLSNLGAGPRTTRKSLDGQRYWVYRRSGGPCRRCGEVIRMKRQGVAGRSTYWCPACQPARRETQEQA